MRRVQRGVCVVLAAGAAACSDPAGPDVDIVELSWQLGEHGAHWATGFADHPLEKEMDWQLAAYLRYLPPPLDEAQRGLYFTARNHADDLFMYFTREIEGLVPGARYDADFEVEIASNAPLDCAGVGGSPGEAQWLKVGVVNFEPVVRVEGEHHRLNADIGAQSSDGAHATVLGNIGVPTDCLDPVFALKQLATTTRRPSVVADRDGRAWLIVGVDSGYEGLIEVYFTSLAVTLTPRE